MTVFDGQVMIIRKKPRYANCQAVSRQILVGLDFLRKQAIIHSGIVCTAIATKVATDIFLDLQPADIFFSADDATTFSPVEWLSGAEVEDSAPRYLIPSQRPRGMLDDVGFQRLSVWIGDLGGGCPFSCL